MARDGRRRRGGEGGAAREGKGAGAGRGVVGRGATPAPPLDPAPPPHTPTPVCREPGKQYPPFTAYWRPAVTNCLGPACGFEALKYISYPAQVLLLPLLPPAAAACCWWCCVCVPARVCVRACVRANGVVRRAWHLHACLLACLPAWSPPLLTARPPTHPPTHQTTPSHLHPPGSGQVLQNDPGHADGHAAVWQGVRAHRVRLLHRHLK